MWNDDRVIRSSVGTNPALGKPPREPKVSAARPNIVEATFHVGSQVQNCPSRFTRRTPHGWEREMERRGQSPQRLESPTTRGSVAGDTMTRSALSPAVRRLSKVRYREFRRARPRPRSAGIRQRPRRPTLRAFPSRFFQYHRELLSMGRTIPEPLGESNLL